MKLRATGVRTATLNILFNLTNRTCWVFPTLWLNLSWPTQKCGQQACESQGSHESNTQFWQEPSSKIITVFLKYCAWSLCLDDDKSKRGTSVWKSSLCQRLQSAQTSITDCSSKGLLECGLNGRKTTTLCWTTFNSRRLVFKVVDIKAQVKFLSEAHLSPVPSPIRGLASFFLVGGGGLQKHRRLVENCPPTPRDCKI